MMKAVTVRAQRFTMTSTEDPFEDDADDKIDTALTEEEDWIEYIKRNTEKSMEKMESTKIRCWNKTQKNEMEIGTEIRNISE